MPYNPANRLLQIIREREVVTGVEDFGDSSVNCSNQRRAGGNCTRIWPNKPSISESKPNKFEFRNKDKVGYVRYVVQRRPCRGNLRCVVGVAEACVSTQAFKRTLLLLFHTSFGTYGEEPVAYNECFRFLMS